MFWPTAQPLAAAEPFRTVSRGTTAGETAESAGKLKWLPHRPSMPVAASANAPAPQLQAAKSPTRLVQHDTPSPFLDPFGDGSGASGDERSEGEPGLVPLIPPEMEMSEADDAAYRSGEPGMVSNRTDRARAGAEGWDDRAPSLDEECPTLKELKPIGEITYRIDPEPGDMPRECELDDTPFQPRYWAQTTFLWKASALCHKPLYFEDVHLERYGHSWGPLLQPFMSGAHFFGSVLALPYTAGMDPPHECVYTLGYYRPGSCAPYMLDPIPLSVRGAVVAGGIWTGGVYAIP